MANIVHVVGTGTIGEPLIGLLCHFKDELGLDEITFNKRTPLYTDRSKVQDLLRRGTRFKVYGVKKGGVKVHHGWLTVHNVEAKRSSCAYASTARG